MPLNLSERVALLEAENALLKAANDDHEKERVRLVTDNESLIAKNTVLEGENEHLSHHVTLLKAALYGKKSEKNRFLDHPGQTSLFGQLFNESEIIKEAEKEEEASCFKSSNRPKKGRRPLPEHLPRKEVVHDLDEEEKHCACGSELTFIGQEVSEQLDYIPAKMRVLKHIKYKYACKCCQETIKLAKAPRVLAKSIASSGLLSHVLVSKFCDHLPLYRQSQMWQREGIDISRKTLSGWVCSVGDLLQDVIDAMHGELIRSDYVCSDETTLRVLEIEKGQPYMWVHMSGERSKRVVIYDYHPNRSGSCADNFLSGFEGFHQSDGYSGYEQLHGQEKVTYVGCMAHARRKFHEIVKLIGKEGVAKELLKLINKLYGIERDIQMKKLTPDKIKRYRQKHSLPVLTRLKERLMYYQNKTVTGTPLARAINYTLNQWDGLTAYLKDGRLRIDNNDTERAMKAFAIGRKNWMFNNTEFGAKASANIFSVIETCKANAVEPRAYLKYLLDQMPHYRNKKEQLVDLLPYNVDKDKLNEADKITEKKP